MSISKIEWTDYTFNPWWGCARVSPACRSCYADTLATRYGHDQLWRRKGPRRMMSDAHWKQPLKWNRDAERDGTPKRVFCASMADVFEDHPDVVEPRKRLWDLIENTPRLHWQLLTKRPENVAAMAPWGADWPENVWLGTSVENQRWAEARIPHLLAAPARTRFLSCEPLLGPVDLSRWLGVEYGEVVGDWIPEMFAALNGRVGPAGGLHWIICGGESGAKPRATELDWVRTLLGQCEAAGVPAFMKQLGTAWSRAAKAASRKGGDPDEWPADLRVRHFPEPVMS
jgi:protein gp37